MTGSKRNEQANNVLSPSTWQNLVHHQVLKTFRENGSGRYYRIRGVYEAANLWHMEPVGLLSPRTDMSFIS